ncbi:MAG: GGDEF domain-containing protein [Desulfarculus sp.]|nr:GGDEF domain-containing protein [Desulfarculus sp.]
MKAFAHRPAWLLLLALMCWGLALPCAAQEPPAPSAWAAQGPHLPSLEILEDPGGQLGLEEVSSPAMRGRFQPWGARPLSLGLKSGAVWLRFDLPPALPATVFGREQARFLELGKAIIDQVDIHLPLEASPGDRRHLAAGTTRPRPAAQAVFRTPVFLLPAGLDPSRPAYVRLSSQISLSMAVRVWTVRDFMGHAFRDGLAFGVIFGAMVAMVIFNLLIFLSLRQKAYVAYIFYVLSMLMAQLSLQGHLGAVLTLPQPGLAQAQALFMACSMFFAALFTRVFLDSRQNAPFWDKMLNIFLYAPVVMAGLVLAGRLDLGNPLGYATGALGPLHAICTAAACLRRGFHSARFFLAAWTVLVISVFAFELVSLGWLPHSPWTAYLLPVGTALESLLLTLALADRIRLLNQERQELASSQRRYQELSVTDGLTGLYNLRFLKSKLTSEMEHARRLDQPLSLIMLDLDDFKAFNDAHGHVEGDRLLLGVARVLKRTVREGDVACRYGGEEFTVLLPGTGLDAAQQVAERIRRGVEQLGLWPRSQHEVRVTVSLGVARLGSGEDAQDFIHRADQALYQAKAQGKNRCVKALGSSHGQGPRAGP